MMSSVLAFKSTTFGFILSVVVVVVIFCALGVESASPFWGRSFRQRTPSVSPNWRFKNTLALASNKSTCDGDFYFMLDSSTSIGEKVFKHLTKYLKRVVSMFSPGQVQHRGLQVGLIRFASRVDVLSRLRSVNDSSLKHALDEAPFIGGKPSIARAFRLLTAPSLWSPATSNPAVNARLKSKLKPTYGDYEKRRRLLVVFTDGHFGDIDSELIRATLAVCRQMSAPVVFIGINGESSAINVRRLLSLTDSPQNLYFLGAIGVDSMPNIDELSAWNLAAYLCYSLNRHSS